MSPSSAWIQRLAGAVWAVLTLLLALPGGPAPIDELPWLAPPQVEWGHCTVVERSSLRLCIYDPEDPVRLWVDHPRASEAQVRIDGADVAVERFTLADEPHGQGLRVAIGPGAGTLELRVPEAEGLRVWGLPLRERALEQAEQAEGPDFTALGAAWAAGDAAQMERATTQAVDALLERGRMGDAVGILCGTAFHLRRIRAFAAAARMLDSADAIGSTFPVGRNNASIYRGLLLWSQGALYEAAVRLRDGARLSARLEDPVGLEDSLPIYAEALAELGYFEEAKHWARQSLTHLPASPCDRASVLRTAGWINLVLRASDQPHDDPRPQLQDAIEVYEAQAECAHMANGAWLSLALLELEDGNATVARERLDALDRAELSAEDRVRAADLRVRLQLALDADASAAWRELEAAARVVDDDDGWWRVDVRHGEVLRRAHDEAGALAAFERAEQRLDRLVRAQAVMGVGRTATADRYLEGTTALVSLLVDQQQPARALCVVREARARRRSASAGIDALPAAERDGVRAKLRRYREHKRRADEVEASVPERPRAQEPTLLHDADRASQAARALVDDVVESLMRASASPRCEELVPAAPGELLVAFHPRGSDWLIFTQNDVGDTGVHEIEAPSAAELAGDPRVLAERLLDPIAESLAAASRVRVLATGRAQDVDVHLLPWRGESLLARIPVSYGVELRALPAAVVADPPRALLLADPTGTLMSTGAEIQAVSDRLVEAGWIVDRPSTEDVDTPIDAGFRGAALLHYAAHTATRDEGSGRWAPYTAGEARGRLYLQIGPTARLEVHDILALRPVPPLAFLAGCKTGLVDLDAGSTSVALAFLLADGREVVAARENVQDVVAKDIASRFYASLVRGGDASVAMHHVQHALSREGAGVGPYRVWVR